MLGKQKAKGTIDRRQIERNRIAGKDRLRERLIEKECVRQTDRQLKQRRKEC